MPEMCSPAFEAGGSGTAEALCVEFRADVSALPLCRPIDRHVPTERLRVLDVRRRQPGDGDPGCSVAAELGRYDFDTGRGECSSRRKRGGGEEDNGGKMTMIHDFLLEW